MCSTAILQVRYLNEAMERFGNTETVPVYYVLFTLTTILGSNVLYRDFENEDRWTVIVFCSGCALTCLGVKLLTSRRHRPPPPSFVDQEPPAQRSAPLLQHPHGGPCGGEACAAAPASSEPLLDRHFLAPSSRGALHTPRPPPPVDTDRYADADRYADRYAEDQPLTLVGTPMTLSGDILHRTFSDRLNAFSERARAEGSGSSLSSGSRGRISDGGRRDSGGGAGGGFFRHNRSSSI